MSQSPSKTDIGTPPHTPRTQDERTYSENTGEHKSTDAGKQVTQCWRREGPTKSGLAVILLVDTLVWAEQREGLNEEEFCRGAWSNASAVTVGQEGAAIPPGRRPAG
jgi:hypothetical protein